MVPGPDLAIALCCVLAAIGGLVANSVLIFLIASDKELRRKDYIRFILNRAIMDLVNCLLLATLHPVAILVADSDSPMCKASGFLELALGLASVYSEPFLACNRYVSTLRGSINYEKIYTRRNVYLMCASSWMLGVLTVMPHAFINSLGRETGLFCSVRLSRDNMVTIIVANYSVLLGALASVVFFYCKMYLYLRKYQNQQTTTNRQRRSELQNDREILRFILVSAFLPMTLQTPGVAASWIRMFQPISGWILFAGAAGFVASILVSPFVTLMMVRQIRKQLMKRIKRVVDAIRHRKVTTIQVEPIG